MALYKRGSVYWYNFEFLSRRYQGSTHLRNRVLAERFQTKLKSDLALGLVGLVALKPGPLFSKYVEQFTQFLEMRNAEHPETISFYKEKIDRLLEYKPLANARLNQIDKALVEEYVQHRRKKVSVASVNRELATLRRALRLAWHTFRLIQSVPLISLLPGEHPREFVLSYEQEKAYLAVAEDPLRDFAILSLDTGVRVGEGLNLTWQDVHFTPAYQARLGSIGVRRGKSKNAQRVLPMTERVHAMLSKRRRFHPKAKFVFPGRRKGAPILVSSVDHQHVRARAAAQVETPEGRKESLPAEFVIHSLRHTFGTRLGESGADPFDIMKAMGHSSVTISQRYVHPSPERMERAFENLEAMTQILRGEKEAERKLGVATVSTTGVKSQS